MDYKILRLTDRPELKEQAARWFHEKWGIPLEAYMESMEECLEEKGPVPQWYMALDGERIIGGMGVIENAGSLLRYVCADMKEKGIDPLYLITDHTSFYERYGWEYLCMVQGEGEAEKIRMYIHRGEE